MLNNYLCYFFIALIKIYQKTLSFDHGILRFFHPYGYCRFKPTCSEYAIKALEKYGFVKGGIKSLARIIRCNPFNPGGWDPLI